MLKLRVIAHRCNRTITCVIAVTLTSISSFAGADSLSPMRWRADHHMHLASPDLCRRVGECLASNHPPAVLAADAVQALDEAHVGKGVILSCAYLYGMPALHLSESDIAAQTRRENEFTAGEVARHPSRLVGFLSVNPLQPTAIQEIRHWAGSRQLIGLKLHFTASDVHMRDVRERAQVARVFEAAALAHLPIVVHVGGGDFNESDADTFIREVLPSAGSTWVQIAHAAGGLPLNNDNHVQVLRAFADHIVRDDPMTRRVLFDLSYVPAPEEHATARIALMKQVRRIGISRFVFGSDFNVLRPVEAAANLRLLRLTKAEADSLRNRCAPWAC